MLDAMQHQHQALGPTHMYKYGRSNYKNGYDFLVKEDRKIIIYFIDMFRSVLVRDQGENLQEGNPAPTM